MCRDQNAAINILQKGLRTVGQPETTSLELENALGDSPSTLVGQVLLEQGQSQNEESHSL